MPTTRTEMWGNVLQQHWHSINVLALNISFLKNDYKIHSCPDRDGGQARPRLTVHQHHPNTPPDPTPGDPTRGLHISEPVGLLRMALVSHRISCCRDALHCGPPSGHRSEYIEALMTICLSTARPLRTPDKIFIKSLTVMSYPPYKGRISLTSYNIITLGFGQWAVHGRSEEKLRPTLSQKCL